MRTNRREFLRAAADTSAAVAAVLGSRSIATADNAALDAKPPLDQRKLILVVFGGGTRSSESIGDPDHGRQLEQPGGPGFVHHSDFYTGEGAGEGCRRVWMLALGPAATLGRTIDRPTPITAAAATGLHFLGLPVSEGAASPAIEL
jgi:hypothetical protein